MTTLAPSRDMVNLATGILGEAAASLWLGLEPRVGVITDWRDGGSDIRTVHGSVLDVKSTTRWRWAHHLDIPVAHEDKFRRSRVDELVRVYLKGREATIVGCYGREDFLRDARRDGVHPIPTLCVMLGGPLHRIELPAILIARVDAIVREQSSSEPWTGWLTL